MKGDQPGTTLCDPTMSQPGSSKSKSSTSGTLMVGVNFDAELLPVELMLQTAAKSAEREQVEVECFRPNAYVTLQAGMPEPTEMPCSVTLNEKGGMTARKFVEFLRLNVYPCYPDACNLPGYRVCHLTDMGPR